MMSSSVGDALELGDVLLEMMGGTVEVDNQSGGVTVNGVVAAWILRARPAFGFKHHMAGRVLDLDTNRHHLRTITKGCIWSLLSTK